VIPRRTRVSEEALRKHAEDVEFAAEFDDLLEQARVAEKELRDAEAAATPLVELHRLGKQLDEALTTVMRSAFAAERAAIGARGYDDRIYRRKAKATPPVRVWTAEAEHLLTLRESHRLTGIIRVPRKPAA
jgi:hypothetical protein